MPLSAGTRLAQYDIVSPLGAGGMGEVYRATDTKLNRTVAIKAMRAAAAFDADHVARFEREAQILASLNHPNIAAIHGLETVDGASYLILEFVEGRTLADLLRDGAMPPAEAIPLARQIASAIGAAHERGIIHRDLKPGNVMVTSEGQVKVLDFGLGKAIDPGSTTAEKANSPTMTLAATQAGIILGTAGYMSPEQAKGRNADKRSDVWAFGCVLFEMLSGARPFDGEDVTETLAAIVRGEPNWTALPPATPAQIRSLIERCLVKSPADRLADMSVVRFVLNERLESDTRDAGGSERRRVVGIPAVAAMVVAALLTGGAIARSWPSAPAGRTESEPVRVSIVLPDGDFLANLNLRPMVLSKDGRMLAYVAVHDGVSQLFVRTLDNLTPRLLEGTSGASMPFFSWDGKWIGFFAQGQLKKITVDGAGLTTVGAAGPSARGGTWAADDTIYFAPGHLSGIVSVPAAGGDLTPVTTLDQAAGEVFHQFPTLLPDGQTLLFTAWRGPGLGERDAAVQRRNESRHRILLPGGGEGVQYVAGHLVYANGESLFALPWRPGQAETGRSVAPSRQVEQPRWQGTQGLFTVSDSGTLMFVPSVLDRLQHRLVWVDRQGRVTPVPLAAGEYVSVALSPDGTRAAVEAMGAVLRLWIYDFRNGSMEPLTTDKASSQAPVWTPDGKWIMFRGTRGGARNVYRIRSDGTGTEERLTSATDAMQTPWSVSPDGELLALSASGATGNVSLLLLPLAGGGERIPRPFVASAERMSNAHFSPDGRWLAYESDRSGRIEIYVRPFPGPDPATPVSVGGGREPLWSLDGRELFYVTPDLNRLMSVAVSSGGTGNFGPPRTLLEGTYRASGTGSTAYSVDRDGRFLRLQSTQPDRPVTRFDVVLNWKPIEK